jgi:hypothetical protein
MRKPVAKVAGKKRPMIDLTIETAGFEATVIVKRDTVHLSQNLAIELTEELGHVPTLRDMLIEYVRDTSGIGGDAVTITKVGRYTAAKCEVIEGRTAAYMVSGRKLSTKAMQDALAEPGAEYTIRALTEEEAGTWEALDLDTPIYNEAAEPLPAVGEDDEDAD